MLRTNNIYYILIFLSLLTVVLFFAVTFADEEERQFEQRLNVVTTTGMIADAVRQIGGEKVYVHSLIPQGADPHIYKASHSDIRYLLNAQLIFYHGLKLEGKMTTIFENSSLTANVHAVTDQIPHEQLIYSETEHDYPDPHIWFDPTLWMIVVDDITEHLIAYDKSNRSWYLTRAKQFKGKLKTLHQQTQVELQNIPKQKKVLITAHDAFAYFARAYQLEVVGLQGVSTDAQYGLTDVQSLVNFIIERKIPTIFMETTISDRSLRAVQAGVEQQGGKVSLGRALYSDSLGVAGTESGTYHGMFTHNVSAIIDGLERR